MSGHDLDKLIADLRESADQLDKEADSLETVEGERGERDFAAALGKLDKLASK